MAERIVGIDLGTTNSEIAALIDGVPTVLAENHDPIVPSVVGMTDDGKLLVGRPARNQWVLAPERTVKSIKRKMGDDVQVPLGAESYRPQELSAMILRELKNRAERVLKEPIHKAVITVPAYFNDTQREATREAGALAGLDVVRILNEPTAAALVYDANQTTGERFLVYDLGGGTFDVSILQAEQGIFEVLASHGDTHLGGDDFDELLLNHVADEFLELYGVDLRTDRVCHARVLKAVEDAKHRLSDHATTRIEEEFLTERDGVPLHLSMEIERGEYEELIEPLLQRTMECVQLALNDAKLTASQIQRIVLVGGSTRTPLIRRLLQQRLGQEPHSEIHPDLCVALGAAVQGAIIAGETVGKVLIDVSSHSLGIKCLEYAESYSHMPNEFRFARIIPRNSTLPTSRSEVFCTVSDNQNRVDVEVFQGESDDVRRNHRVGKFFIEGLSRVPAGNQLLVQLDLTLDGSLKVSAREKATGLVKQITIENAMARFAVEERASAQSRLKRLWDSPSIDDETDDETAHEDEPMTVASALPSLANGPQEGQREIVQAQALLEKTERLLSKVQPEDQATLTELMASVNAALVDRRWGDLKTMTAELSDALFYLEDA